MKKSVSTVIVFFMVVVMLISMTGCNNKGDNSKKKDNNQVFNSTTNNEKEQSESISAEDFEKATKEYYIDNVAIENEVIQSVVSEDIDDNNIKIELYTAIKKEGDTYQKNHEIYTVNKKTAIGKNSANQKVDLSKYIKQSNQNSTSNKNDLEESDNSVAKSGTVREKAKEEVVGDKDGDFLMPIEDVFFITGRGTVATGTIKSGTIKLNDEIQIIGLDKELRTVKVTGIEQFRKLIDSATVGDSVGLLLSDVERTDVERGQVLATPDSIKSATKFEAEVFKLTKEEGGINTPIVGEYKSQFYFRTTDVTGTFKVRNSNETINPGDDNVKITVELQKGIAMEEGTWFVVREGGRTIMSGYVTKVIE